MKERRTLFKNRSKLRSEMPNGKMNESRDRKRLKGSFFQNRKKPFLVKKKRRFSHSDHHLDL